MKCEDIAKHHDAFTATNSFVKAVFIKEGFSDDDQIELLFHEEAHIWYNHLTTTGYVDHTVRQHERVANLFQPRLRILKAVFYLLLASTFFVGTLLFLPRYDSPAQIPTQTVATQDPIPNELEEVEKAADEIETVYITAHGDCYHQKACDQIADSDTVTPITITMAEQLGKRPCITCCY